MTHLISKVCDKIIFNRARPFLSKKLYNFCNRYVEFFNGDRMFEIKTDGELNVFKLLNSGPVIFDVGANAGDYTSSAIKYTNSPLIYCFEPDVTVFGQLYNRFKSNRSVTLNQQALGSEDTEADFYLNSASHFSSFLPNQESKKVAVRAGKLDTYCEHNKIEKIDLLKIDTEGFDYDVLLKKGATVGDK